MLQRGLGRSSLFLYRSFVRGRDKCFSLLCSGGFAAFGSHSVLQLPVRLVGERRIAVGSGVFVGAGSWLQVLADDSDELALVIGDGTTLAGGCVLSASRWIRIGRGVLMARNVYVADHMHEFGDRTRAVLDQGVTRVLPVEILDGAWLGENVVVGPGVTIGRGAVIGANSVVLDDVPDHAVAVGAPARVVRLIGEEQVAAT